MNVSELAVAVSKSEGLKKQTNIAQIKETLKATAIEIAKDEDTLKKFIQYGQRLLKNAASGK